MNKIKKQDTIKKYSIEKLDILIFFIIILVFGFTLMAYAPGLMTSDCFDQIEQAKSMHYHSAHPIFHTFIIGNIAKIFGTISAPAIFQILVFSTIWTWGCKVARENNNSKLNKVFQVALTSIIALTPINAMFSITLWKDILYSYSFLAGIIYIYIGIKHKFKFSILQIILISLSSICIMKFRYNGVPIGALIYITLMIFNLYNERKIKKSIIFIFSFILIYILTSIPGWYYLKKETGIQSPAGVLTCTKIYCFGALLNEEIEIEKEDKEFLSNILDLEEWKNGFEEYSGNSILFNPKLNTKILNKDNNLEKFNNIFSKYAKMKPNVIFKHFIAINSIWWSPKELAGMHSIITNNDFGEEYQQYITKPVSKTLNHLYGKYVLKTLSNRIIYIVLYRPATYLIISVLGIAVIIYKRKKISYILLIIPELLNIGTYVFIISSQDGRYFYPNFMTAYLVILVVAELCLKPRFVKNKQFSKNNEQKDKNSKTLIIVPAYNEEGAIKNTVNKIYEMNKNVDVIVINDGSKDKTLQEARKTDAIVIDAPSNLGIGGAVQTGYLYAYKNNYDIAIQVDGDGQHDPKYIAKMVEILSNEDIDMVIGSRFIQKTEYKQTFMRMLGINIISILINLFTEEKIYDTTSGYRAVNREIIKSFAEDYPYDYPEPVTTMQMILKGMKVKEIPVTMKQRETGISSISPLKSILYMIKVILSLILNSFKKYN